MHKSIAIFFTGDKCLSSGLKRGVGNADLLAM